ncbi:MAG: hypothetical protein D6683_14150 [Actinomyces sp.]|nr:MAG: hypothetical protein D6683_14150 [Actinomyces sp.]
MVRERSGVVVAGASDDTGNLGVTALNRSILAALHHHRPDLEITVFDFGQGERVDTCRVGDTEVAVRRCAHRPGRRYWRSDNLSTARALARVGPRVGPAASLARARACLDIGGGDSFTDLYGPQRFAFIAALRRLALGVGTPLVLLPQTYGPFRSPRRRAEASRIVRAATQCWARDRRSFEALTDLVGDAFDPARHRLGVDVAFALPPRRPADAVLEALGAWSEPGTVGLNVSGLVYNDPRARERYGHRLDYRVVVDELVRRLLAEGIPRLLLVPHVHAAPGEIESDRTACEAVRDAVDPSGRRIRIAPDLDADEIKWVISRLEWFCGTRMHATIAALSSGVPTATIAYSLKALGVFESCDAGDHVADARELDENEALEVVLASFARRHERELVATAAERQRRRALDQMADILEVVG